ncbi:MAG: hypothetical protein GF344_07755 [Chitinivibrionales bacterium]|nr:hypothetical protein [Chitinivibrionales bacterium]
MTICTQDRIDRFGAIENGKMILNDAGKMVESVWDSLPERFPMVTLDTFQIMPNHIHAIIIINPPVHTVGTPLVGVRHGSPNDASANDCHGSGDTTVDNDEGRTGTRPVPTDNVVNVIGAKQPPMLGNIIGAFNSIITNRYIIGVKMGLVPPFQKRLLQSRFYDHIIRNENELYRIRQYIKNNPANWQIDRMGPVSKDARPCAPQGVSEETVPYGEEP